MLSEENSLGKNRSDKPFGKAFSCDTIVPHCPDFYQHGALIFNCLFVYYRYYCMVKEGRKEAVGETIHFRTGVIIWPELYRGRVIVVCLSSESRRKPKERSAIFPAVRLGRKIRGLSGFSAGQNLLVRSLVEERNDAYWVLHAGERFGVYDKLARK